MLVSRLRGIRAPRGVPDADWSRVLVLGSANYVADWWAKHGEGYQDWTVLAINNAWAVPGADRIDLWARSKHFWRLGRVQPPSKVHKKAIYIQSPPQARIDIPWRTAGGGTMFVSVLWRVLAEAEKRGVKTMVSVAGSDFDYRGAKTQTHFYGGGKMTARTRDLIRRTAPSWAEGKAADPLRFGLEWLRNCLGDVHTSFGEGGHKIYNVGEHHPSELPFPRVDPATEPRS